MDSITLGLCDALARLTLKEWNAIKPIVDARFSSITQPLYDELQAKLDPMTCDATGSEIYEGTKAWLGHLHTLTEKEKMYFGLTANTKVDGSAELSEKLRKLAIELIDKGVSTPDDVTSIAGVIYAYKEIATMVETTSSTSKRDSVDLHAMSKRLCELIGQRTDKY